MEIKEMRHEVIEYAIFLENYLDDNILSYFGLDAFEASYFMILYKEREFFRRTFLDVSLGRKLDLIIKIIKECGEELSKEFHINKDKFLKIRNKFAHNIYPEIDKNFQPKIIVDHIKLEQEEWNKMYMEAKYLYWKIIEEIDSKFYTTKEPRIKKHKNFNQMQMQGIIKDYENQIKEMEKQYNK